MDSSQIKEWVKNLRPCKKIVANELGGKEFDSVLEVGCQWGESIRAVKDAFPDKKCAGLDIDELQLEQARELSPNITFILGDAVDLPFKDESFDVVFTSALFCMINPTQVEKSLNEIIRVAKKYIYLVELDINLLIGVIDRNRVAANWVALFKERGFKADKRRITNEEWDVLPWTAYGALISVDKNEKINPTEFQ